MKPPAPGPVSVLSATHETNAAAMHASTALPPSRSTSAPASAVSGCPAATAPFMAQAYSGRGCQLLSWRLTKASPLAREAMLSAALAAASASLLVWLGPPGADLAEHAYQRTLFLEHGFALWNNFWYAGRYSFVTYSVLYYPVAALLGIRLLAVATVATAALAFAVVIGRQWGPGRALVEPDLRGRLGGDRALGGVSLRAGSGARARCDLGPSGPQPLALRTPRGADARRQPARLPAADAAAGGVRPRAAAGALDDARAGAHDRGVRRGRGRSLEALSRRALPVFDRGAVRGGRLLRLQRRADLADRARASAALGLRHLPRRVPRRVPDPVCRRGKRRAFALRGAADGRPDALTPALAPLAGVPGRPRARGLVERDADRRPVPQGAPRSRGRPRHTGSRPSATCMRI